MGIESDYVRLQDLEGDSEVVVYNLDTGIGNFVEIPDMCNKVSTKLRFDLVQIRSLSHMSEACIDKDD